MQYVENLTDNSLEQLLQHYGMRLKLVANGQSIPGSHWGDSEAGLISSVLYVRPDTPIHSALHETCHYICMDDLRRENLHTDAGGDYDEENAVCYLQILLAEGNVHAVDLGRVIEALHVVIKPEDRGTTRQFVAADALEHG